MTSDEDTQEGIDSEASETLESLILMPLNVKNVGPIFLFRIIYMLWSGTAGPVYYQAQTVWMCDVEIV